MKKVNEVVYSNSIVKVVYLDFGLFFGMLYGIFDIDDIVLSRNTVITARARKSDAIKEADYLYSLHKWSTISKN